MKSEALDEIIRTTSFKNIILNWYCEDIGRKTYKRTNVIEGLRKKGK